MRRIEIGDDHPRAAAASRRPLRADAARPAENDDAPLNFVLHKWNIRA